jgi:hypothetical protein
MWRIWRRDEVRTVFWWEHLSEKGHVEVLDVDGIIILKLIFKKLDGGVGWDDLTQNREK